MMRRIVCAGLPSHVASFLARQLEDVSVRITFGGDDTLAEVRSGRCKVLLIDSCLPGLASEAVVHALRDDAALASVGIVYCLAEGDKAAQDSAHQHLLREFAGIRVLQQPMSLADVGRVTNQLLDGRSPGELHVMEGGRSPGELSPRSVPALLVRRAS